MFEVGSRVQQQRRDRGRRASDRRAELVVGDGLGADVERRASGELSRECQDTAVCFLEVRRLVDRLAEKAFDLFAQIDRASTRGPLPR